METIRVQVSSELARRLRPYQSELPRILEWGLRHVERETEAESPLSSDPASGARRMALDRDTC